MVFEVAGSACRALWAWASGFCTKFLSSTLFPFVVRGLLIKTEYWGKGYPYYEGLTGEPNVGYTRPLGQPSHQILCSWRPSPGLSGSPLVYGGGGVLKLGGAYFSILLLNVCMRSAGRMVTSM